MYKIWVLAYMKKLEKHIKKKIEHSICMLFTTWSFSDIPHYYLPKINLPKFIKVRFLGLEPKHSRSELELKFVFVTFPSQQFVFVEWGEGYKTLSM